MLTIEKLFLSNYNSPFMSYCEILNEDTDDETYNISVFNFNSTTKTISLKTKLQELNSFVFKEDETETEIYNEAYIKECFFIFAISFKKLEEIKCISRIINETGEKIKDLDCNILEISNQETIFYRYEDKIFIERESYFIKDNALFKFDLKTVCNKKEQKISQEEIHDIQQHNIKGYLNYLINRNFIASASIARTNGQNYVRIKARDYFDTEDD